MLALSVRELRKVYDNGFEALRGVDLEVEEGEFFGLLGPNGAGKTTLIGILTSLVRKTSGTVEVFGYDIDRDFAAAKACLGVVPQEYNCNNFETAWRVVVHQAGYYGVPPRQARERAETYLRLLGLWNKRDAVARMLSGGMKRRLMIARAMVHEPRLLILDEPTAGVDIELRHAMWKFLRELNDRGTTIILTTHYLEEAEALCRRLAFLDAGQIVEQSEMRVLMRRLHAQTFVLDLGTPLEHPPLIEGVTTRLIDPTTLEVEIVAGRRIPEVFGRLDALGVDVTSLRNKTGRLEDLFLRILHGKEAGRPVPAPEPQASAIDFEAIDGTTHV